MGYIVVSIGQRISALTLKTSLQIFDRDVNPEAIYALARKYVGIPSDHRIFRPENARALGELYFGHVSGGFDAAVDMTVRLDPTLVCPDQWDYDENGNLEDPEWFTWYADLSLDTAYASSKGLRFHWEVREKVVKEANIKHYRVNNEFTGEYFRSFEEAWASDWRKYDSR